MLRICVVKIKSFIIKIHSLCLYYCWWGYIRSTIENKDINSSFNYVSYINSLLHNNM